MQNIIAWVLVIFPGILFVGQLISSFNFELAQRLGLQEDPQQTDPMLQRAEKYAAYWDIVTLGWLPFAGILMLADNPAWPLLTFFGGAIYLDCSGREAAKYLSFKHAGVRIGSPAQQRFFFATYIIMAGISIVALAYALHAFVQQT